MEDKAKQIKELKHRQKQLVKQYSHIFEEKKQISKEIRDLMNALLTEMVETGETQFSYDDLSFEIRETSHLSHKQDALQELFDDDSTKINDYLDKITTVRTAVKVKKRKLL